MKGRGEGEGEGWVGFCFLFFFFLQFGSHSFKKAETSAVKGIKLVTLHVRVAQINLLFQI